MSLGFITPEITSSPERPHAYLIRHILMRDLLTAGVFKNWCVLERPGCIDPISPKDDSPIIYWFTANLYTNKIGETALIHSGLCNQA